MSGRISEMVRDRAKITNRKSHIGFQMTWKLSTLEEFEGHWQPVPSAILATTGLLVMFYRPIFIFAFLLCLFTLYWCTFDDF